MAKKSDLEKMHLLANSIRRTYKRLRYVTDQIHATVNISAPKRTLLLDLKRDGPQTVPALAAFRCVSRQITQTQINELMALGYVRSEPNPSHKRSPLITLSKAGERVVKEMIGKESAFIDNLDWLPDSKALKCCQEVLDSIYDRLEL